MNNYFKGISIFSIGILLLTACNKDEPSCEDTPSDFNDLYSNAIMNGHVDNVTMDTEIHEYTFELSSDQEVCKIGYQSHPDISSTPYTIEIVDSSNVSIYSVSHFFSSHQTTYVSPASTINLSAGMPYTIRRIQLDYGQNITNTIGRVAHKSNMSFPYTQGVMTITSSNFYQNGGPANNYAIPFIDLVFK